MYYQLKLTAQNDMSKDFSEKQRERFYTGDMYERWECIFSVPVFCRIHADSALLFSGGIYRRIVGGRRSVDTGDRSEIQTG